VGPDLHTVMADREVLVAMEEMEDRVGKEAMVGTGDKADKEALVEPGVRVEQGNQEEPQDRAEQLARVEQEEMEAPEALQSVRPAEAMPRGMAPVAPLEERKQRHRMPARSFPERLISRPLPR
jgi:hypothetical protein